MITYSEQSAHFKPQLAEELNTIALVFSLIREYMSYISYNHQLHIQRNLSPVQGISEGTSLEVIIMAALNERAINDLEVIFKVLEPQLVQEIIRAIFENANDIIETLITQLSSAEIVAQITKELSSPAKFERINGSLAKAQLAIEKRVSQSFSDSMPESA